MPVDPWPLRHLVLRTPRLELRPDDDAGLMELAALAERGVHDPADMPFDIPWTDTPEPERSYNNLRFHWRNRAELRPESWTVSFLARMDGAVVGTQDMTGRDFASRRTVGSGSWLGERYQGSGIGTEMRAAMLLLAFDHLGARTAVTSAWHDNASSLRVSRKLGYREDRRTRKQRRGRRTVQYRLRLDAADLVRPQWTLEVSGVDGCRALLGVG